MDVYGFLLTIIGSSSVSIVGIETFRNWLFKRRVYRISKNILYYIHLARNSWNLGWNGLSQTDQQDSKRLLYYIANMLYYKQKIFNTIGDLQLDNLDAEMILNDLWWSIGLERQLGFVDSSRLCCLADMPYHEFCEKVTNYEILMSQLDKNGFEKCMWYSQLLMLEMNHIYEPWYGEEPKLILRDGLREYLKQKYPKYYRRILNFGRHKLSIILIPRTP